METTHRSEDKCSSRNGFVETNCFIVEEHKAKPSNEQAFAQRSHVALGYVNCESKKADIGASTPVSVRA